MTIRECAKAKRFLASEARQIAQSVTDGELKERLQGLAEEIEKEAKSLETAVARLPH